MGKGQFCEPFHPIIVIGDNQNYSLQKIRRFTVYFTVICHDWGHKQLHLFIISYHWLLAVINCPRYSVVYAKKNISLEKLGTSVEPPPLNPNKNLLTKNHQHFIFERWKQWLPLTATKPWTYGNSIISIISLQPWLNQVWGPTRSIHVHSHGNSSTCLKLPANWASITLCRGLQMENHLRFGIERNSCLKWFRCFSSKANFARL